jgi:hypothetical protein
MRCRVGVDEPAVDKAQSLVHSTERPQCDRFDNFHCGAGILAEPVGEIAMARQVIELDGLLTMLMGACKVTEIPAGLTGNAVRDHGLELGG